MVGTAARYHLPALIIGGGSTSPVPQDLLAKMAELLPDATLVTIEGAGHHAHQTRPEEFLDTVRPFLRRICGSTRRAGDQPAAFATQSTDDRYSASASLVNPGGNPASR